jgi:hypothetical protein
VSEEGLVVLIKPVKYKIVRKVVFEHRGADRASDSE